MHVLQHREYTPTPFCYPGELGLFEGWGHYFHFSLLLKESIWTTLFETMSRFCNEATSLPVLPFRA